MTDIQITDLPPKFWSTTHINVKKNRKKSHNQIPKKFAYKNNKTNKRMKEKLKTVIVPNEMRRHVFNMAPRGKR